MRIYETGCIMPQDAKTDLIFSGPNDKREGSGVSFSQYQTNWTANIRHNGFNPLTWFNVVFCLWFLLGNKVPPIPFICIVMLQSTW